MNEGAGHVNLAGRGPNPGGATAFDNWARASNYNQLKLIIYFNTQLNTIVLQFQNCRHLYINKQ